MFKFSWCPATALLLVACSCAVATPVAMAAKSRTHGHNGGHNDRDSAYSHCPGDICDPSFTALAAGTSKLTNRNSTAVIWWEEGWGTDRVAWSSEMLGPFITIDFGSTVNVRSLTVWGDSAPVSGEASVPDQMSVGGVNFAMRTGSNWSLGAHKFSGLDLISNGVGLRFSQVPSDWDSAGRVPLDSSVSTAPRPATGLLVPGVLIAVGLLGRKRVN